MSITSFRIIDSTLREGEQFALAHFTVEQKLVIAEALDRFGVDYMELTSPVASPQSESDLRRVARTERRFRLLTHVRCNLDDARLAVDTGVDGVDVLIATSSRLRPVSHGMSIDEIVEIGTSVVGEIRGAGREARFSTEDSFRSDPEDLVRIYRAIDHAGVDRVGLADTVGVATPPQVGDLVSLIRRNVGCDIEFHAHDDTGCAVANALAALEAGATHVDTTILGIGERNGIVPLSAMMARLVTLQPELVEHYRLEMLPELDAMLAEILGIAVPFNAAVTAPTAFHHKAGMHTKAVLLDPGAYEVLDPARFGRERSILAGHRLAGRHAIGDRATALGVRLDDDRLRTLTAEVKRRGDDGPLDVATLDELIVSWARA
ncbi:MAG TPA: homocitrate synthase [Candidatus Saccharimonadales bacterium]|nr:homocitrate synthase [Candidatus Saccharimonadales bacterium]